jgi:hypothetical protein
VRLATGAVALLVALVGCAPSEQVDERTDAAIDEVADVCTQDELGGDDAFAFTSAHPVVDGELRAACLGEADQVLLDAWEQLAEITPPGQLGDLAIFAGYTPAGPDAAETLAFVSPVDVDGSAFQMSVNTEAAGADPDELLLTLAHEFTHVFTATPGQLDRTVESVDDCDTYDNGEGCYTVDSVVWSWIRAMWPDELLATVDPTVDSVEDADARCDVDGGFFGPYAATNPEEDFAEAFSAFVFRLDPRTEGQAERLEWFEQRPGLVEFRDRADAAGLTPLENTFEVCG